MHHLAPFLRWLLLRDTPDDVAVAQFREVSRQIPTMYMVVLFTLISSAFVAGDNETGWLVLGVSAIAVPLCAWRVVVWRGLSRRDAIQPQWALGQLRQTVLMAPVVGIIQVGAAITLARLSEMDDMSLMTTLLVAGCIGCIFCLMYLPQAAILIAPTVFLLYIAYLAFDDQRSLMATVAGVAVVSTIVVGVLNRSFITFTSLVRSQSALEHGRREAERLGSENARLAYLDSLTGLPNRRYFFTQLDALVADRAGTDERFAVVLLDLDRFKPVNDTYGHAIGDRLLSEVGDRLSGVSDDRLLIARLGGDEFGVLMITCDDDPGVSGHALCDLVSQPFRLDDLQLSIGCSGGMAIFPDAGATGRELFDRSDYALYHAKSGRRGSCTLFSSEHELHIRSGQVIEAALQIADVEREMDLVFQPIVDIHQMVVVGVEALARWESPVLGLVPPDRFIPVAEGLGFIGTLTRALFRKALAQARILPPELGLSFNLSAHDIGTPETVRAIIDLIEQSGFDPRRITLEITETAVMGDFEVAVTAIERLRVLGVRIALDDFGTGFSSLTHLRRLPLDCVKVDRSFAAGLDDASGHKIVSAIAGLCRNLGLDYVIEGIETQDQLLRVRQFGYRMAQGYLFTMPMAMPAFMEWLLAYELEPQTAMKRRRGLIGMLAPKARIWDERHPETAIG